MTPELAAVIVAALGLLGALLSKVQFGGGMRAALLKDLELHDKLSLQSKSKQAWGEYIDQRLIRIIEREAVLSRDQAGVAVGLFVIATALAPGLLVWSAGSWWRLALLPLSIWGFIGVVGLFTSLSKQKRDEKGKVIKT